MTAVGGALLAVSVSLAGFVGWQVLGTDVVADAEQAQAVAELADEFAKPNPSVNPANPSAAPTEPVAESVEIGDALAIVRIPRFGADYARPLYEGTDTATLQKGIGHYPSTALAGMRGNFSMAGHRTTYGKPFSRIAELQVGDRVIIETRAAFLVYEVYEHTIVRPEQVEVLDPMPGEEFVLTMTACHPEFSSRERYVVHARLDEMLGRESGLPPELLEVKDA